MSKDVIDFCSSSSLSDMVRIAALVPVAMIASTSASRAVHRTFLSGELDDLQAYEHYLPHLQACAGPIERFAFTFEEAIALLYVTGFYLRERAWYSMAEPYSKQALEISEQEFGPESDQVIRCLINLAALYQQQGEYNAAESITNERWQPANIYGGLSTIIPQVASTTWRSLPGCKAPMEKRSRSTNARSLFVGAYWSRITWM
jgi:hypothetical protein